MEHIDPNLRAIYIRLLLEKGDPELWQQAKEIYARETAIEAPIQSILPETAARIVAQEHLRCAKSDFDMYSRLDLKTSHCLELKQESCEKYQIAVEKFNAARELEVKALGNTG